MLRGGWGKQAQGKLLRRGGCHDGVEMRTGHSGNARNGKQRLRISVNVPAESQS